MDGESWRNPWCKLEPHPGADRLVIVFSHINEPKGRFSLYGSFRAVEAHRLFVNAPGNCWYRTGIPSLGDGVERTVEGLAAIVTALAPRTVMTAGCSMGAYASLLFGSLLGADALLAFGPETLLKLPHSRSGHCMDGFAPSPYDDLLPILAGRKGGGPVRIVSGEADAIDLECALRVRHLPGVETRTMRGVGHEVAEALHRHGAFRPLIDRFVRTGDLPAELPLEGSMLTEPNAVLNLAEGRRLRIAGRYDEALARLHACLALCPETALAHDEIGLIATARGNHAAAERSYRQAVEFGPGLAPPAHHLGSALMELGRYAEAEAALRRSLERSPQPAVRLALGLALLKQGREDEAEEALRAAVAKNPGFAMAHHHLGLIAAGRGDHSAAEAAQREAIAHGPRNASFHYRLGLALRAQGRRDEALAALAEAAAINPANPTLRRELEQMRAAERVAEAPAATMAA